MSEGIGLSGYAALTRPTIPTHAEGATLDACNRTSHRMLRDEVTVAYRIIKDDTYGALATESLGEMWEKTGGSNEAAG